MPDRAPVPRWRNPSVVLALVVAVVARVAWLWSKPLWRDEAWVARLAGQSFGRAVQDPHAVPLGFLGLVKLSDGVPGLPPEVSLRLVPLAAGLAAIPVLGALARRLGASWGTTVAALWLASGLPALIYYSRELKPYSLDLLLAALVPWLALEALEPPPGANRARRRTTSLALAACALATPWVSFGANFVVAPTLAWTAWRAGRRTALPAVALLAFAVSFAGAYGTILGPQSESPRLREVWRDELALETAPAPPLHAAGVLGRYFAVSVPYLFPGAWPLAAALAAGGLWTWPRPQRGLLAGLCLGPAAATAAAVVIGRYVIGHGRLLLFAAPPLILMAAAGLVRLGGAAAALAGRGGGERLGAALAAAAALAWSSESLWHRVRPYRNDVERYFLFDILQDVDPIIAEAEQRIAPGEPVMVSRYAGEAFLFYAHGRLPGALVCTRRNCLDEGPVLQGWLRAIRERGWMIVLEEEEASGRRNTARQEGLQVRTAAEARGVRLWELSRRRPASEQAGRVTPRPRGRRFDRMKNSSRRTFLLGAGAAAGAGVLGRPHALPAAERASTDMPRGMTLVSLRRGQELSLGIKTDRGILDVGEAERLFRQNAPTTIDEVFARGGGPELERLLERGAKEAGLFVDERGLEFGPCVTSPQKIVCVGLNYRKHAEETGQPVPRQPILFNKYNTALNAHGGVIPVSQEPAEQFDYEVELVIVMGRRARRVSEADALSHVFGYCTGNDFTARDLQRVSSQWMLGKSLDGSAPIGPYLVTADLVGDPNKLKIECRVNGAVRQSSNTADMVFSCASLVSYISRHFTLQPGDIIFTGTPAGVISGYPKERQVWLKAGDRITSTIEKLGELQFSLT